MTGNEITLNRLSEHPVAGKTLGRHVHHDVRSRSHLASRASRVVSVTHETTGLPLNQETHRCSTAHALCGAMDASPSFSGTLLTEKTAIEIYHRASRLEGETPTLQPETGSSGLMACKAAKELGLISSYEHAFGIDHALEALVLRPVMTGIKWYSSFDSPDPATGLVEIAPDAFVRGGHEVLATGIDAENRLVWFWNSWGAEFGVDGRFCMTFDTWDQLLQDEGDVTVPVK
jgi:hypothetical protein